jgi:oxygen-independent coproporphyrinogen-3 oxidase
MSSIAAIGMNEYDQSIDVSPDLVRKFDRPGPRYTSYPTVPAWRDDFGAEDYAAALARASAQVDEPLSLYVHIPFCHERCAFCGCNVIISRKAGVEDTYLDYVGREAKLVASILGRSRSVRQMHWGGGTPTFLHPDGLRRLKSILAAEFEFGSNAEMAIEVDPRATSPEQVHALRELGFNRVSMGVQDLSPEVQCEIHRHQTEAQTRGMVTCCRDAGFESINIDLVYGLPAQTAESWRVTMDKIVEIRPDRLAIYSYAHLPEKMHNQRRINAGKLPTGQEKLGLLTFARSYLLSVGYEAVGMDHFALPTDELFTAIRQRRLHRNFMGYTVVHAPDMIGLGVSAIGEAGGAFAQNSKKLSTYYQAIDRGKFATCSGWPLTDDDKIRAWVIRELTCNFVLDISELRTRFGVSYDDYFASEETRLQEFYEDGLVRRDGALILATALGRVFVRNIAMVFDAYLQKTATQIKFSRTV